MGATKLGTLGWAPDRRMTKEGVCAVPEHLKTGGNGSTVTVADTNAGSRGEVAASGAPNRRGMRVARFFSSDGKSPFDEVEWDRRVAVIKDEKGKTIFEQNNCEVPKFWSQLATNVVASKYFYGENGTAEREYSARQLIHRVTRTIADWGIRDGYFATRADGERFYDELTWLCLFQYGAFNSPVWFNVGLYHQYGVVGQGTNFRWDPKTRTAVKTTVSYEFPQASACFIQSVDDTMESIMELARSEAMLFKFGSGTGTDLSTLRSSKEKLSGGGRPSGPVSFMRVYDAIASVVKSGGKTRRAAKMQTLKCWHPDIVEFIDCKANEERKAHALIRQGYGANFNDEAYSSVMFQNANLSVRCTDEFLQAAVDDGPWHTRGVTHGEVAGTYRAQELMHKMAEGTWICGDPGVQYEDTIQRWHTCPNTAPINSSNPCSEYMHIDDSACNLSSLNLMKFRRPDGSFDTEAFRAAVRIFITAQEILVDSASYPNAKIAANAHKFRQLGLGYANLGSLIMSAGAAYDSEAARGLCGAITAIMTGQAYLTSAEHASNLGPFEGFVINRDPMLRVMQMHRDAVDDIDPACPDELIVSARHVWDECLATGRQHGYRNAQATVLAPTGTISFLMDCDTTGIEPDIALVKYKQLAGGGMLKIPNRTVPLALERLGYDEPTVRSILNYLEENDTIEGAPSVRPEHLQVFDCAFKPMKGQRAIHYMAHLRMMSAAQPFISGAISKTVNMPRESSVEDITQTYLEGWRLGLKAVAIYRDGSKESQPLSTESESSKQNKKEGSGAPDVRPAASHAEAVDAAAKLVQHDLIPMGPRRERLPDTRRSLTHKFSIGGHEGYVIVGFYEDGRPGELFINMAKEGSTIGGLMDTIGVLTSLALQYGVPIDALVRKFEHARFEPNGFTRNPDIPIAKSVVDYVFRWLGVNYVPGYREMNVPNRSVDGTDPGPLAAAVASGPALGMEEKRTEQGVSELRGQAESNPSHTWLAQMQSDAPPCDECGAITVRNGACFKCLNCGNSMGCS
jgi:ribonucleoside-diphosphate reductase alpha chain